MAATTARAMQCQHNELEQVVLHEKWRAEQGQGFQWDRVSHLIVPVDAGGVC
jgi:hypothetical protein